MIQYISIVSYFSGIDMGLFGRTRTRFCFCHGGFTWPFENWRFIKTVLWWSSRWSGIPDFQSQDLCGSYIYIYICIIYIIYIYIIYIIYILYIYYIYIYILCILCDVPILFPMTFPLYHSPILLSQQKGVTSCHCPWLKRGIFQLASGNLLQFAIENGHRNSEFSH